MNSKAKQYFDFTTKVLSSRNNLIYPFPKDIEHLLVTYINFSYYLCVFPFRVSYDKVSCQYQPRYNIIHIIIYILLWSTYILEFFADVLVFLPSMSPNDTIGVLLLLGAFGHLSNIIIFLATTVFSRDKIIDLINFFLLGGPSDLIQSKGSSIPQLSDDTYFQKKSSYGWPSFLTYKNSVIAFWFASVIAGLRCTAIVEGYIYKDTLTFTLQDSKILAALQLAIPSFGPILNSSFSPFIYILKAFFAFDVIIGYFNDFVVIFVYGLEVMVALSMKLICLHFTRSVVDSRDYWKPSSNTILTSFLLIRQSCRMANKIFGWLMFFTIMGEFPNLTFAVVFAYKGGEGIQSQMSYIFGSFFEVLILSSAALMVLELSKLKEWLHSEEKRQWSSVNKGSLQRRIILFELSLNRYALYGHGFFQLSLPAIISIMVGILSNALIILQLDLST